MHSPRLILNAWLSSARSCWQVLAPFVYFLALLALFPGMLVVQFGLELAFGVMQPDPKIKMSSSSLITLGLVWLVAAVASVEFSPYSTTEHSPNNDAPKLPPKYQAWDVVFHPGGQSVIGVIVIQWIIIILYAGFLDGGLMFRGCLYSYLISLVGPIVFFT